MLDCFFTAYNLKEFFENKDKKALIIIIIKGHSLQRACLQPATNKKALANFFWNVKGIRKDKGLAC